MPSNVVARLRPVPELRTRSADAAASGMRRQPGDGPSLRKCSCNREACFSNTSCCAHQGQCTGMDEITYITHSTLTCPKCGHHETEKMPTDACQFYYDCKGCGELLRPLSGDCCVFCSYGDVKCPPIQTGKNCC